MRPQADESQAPLIWLGVDQDQIGFDVAIPIVLPIAGQGVIAAALGQGFVASERRHDRSELFPQRFPMRPLLSRL
jgi:hypothetical protein